MNYNDFSSKKYIFLLIVICIMFVIFVVKAYDYLPEDEMNNIDTGTTVTNENYNTTFNTTSNIVRRNNDSEEYKYNNEDDTEKHKSGHIDFFKPYKSNNYDDIEEIDAPEGALKEDLPKQTEDEKNTETVSNDEIALKCFINGKKYKSEKDYSNALTELQRIPDLTNDKELNAMSYEEIAEIYAVMKKYGTALSFASKAYQASPSYSREILIARIYYNAGDTENAIKRMNNALKRGF